ncbi:uncharacterized protein LOC106087589 isoform X2 [Stomoxys calcitrans]|uniref:Uncharacterized protein n=1 Tax=Stomoxys calcitrans TaxID=35570 RepID=A0A1I8NP11_STOCA|nr:uncharacterized protein LOC106087589 isoform X2 [Stomoxys calcitrans]
MCSSETDPSISTKAITFKMFTHIVLQVLWITLTLNHCTMAGQSLTTAIHRTQAAQERINDLKCYKCDTMDDGELCVDVLASNATNFIHKCEGEEFICMVKRFSYTTSNENSTSSPKMWSLDRRCAVNCEPGCIVIGERTKLYACTSCCESSMCNTGKGSASSVLYRRIETGIGTLLGLTLVKCFLSYIS